VKSHKGFGLSLLGIVIMVGAIGSVDAQVVRPVGNGNIAVDMAGGCGVVFSPNGNVVTQGRSCSDDDVRRARQAFETWRRQGGSGGDYADGDVGRPDF
jgi:hypothetical protein